MDGIVARVSKIHRERQGGGCQTHRDPNTLSNYDEFGVKHVDVDFKVDFDREIVSGSVVLDVVRQNNGKEVDTLVLDTSYVKITKVIVAGKVAEWMLTERVEPFGCGLVIGVNKHREQFQVSIFIETTDQCTALQWLKPEQTSNKRNSFMFSQCQAIHARSIFPCQDTPDVKSSVNFRIHSPLPVIASGLMVSIEGESDAKGEKVYTFSQKVPIPMYLFAIASGEMVNGKIGHRSSVWSSPDKLKQCQWELEDSMDRFMGVAEKLIFGYVWGEQNVLVMPDSFPYGGMENPVYTFATPSVISGDRSNVNIIAHELAHSWSGNLVSNASWEHFWLNEGWTRYLERRILGEIEGESYRGICSILGEKSLEEDIQRFGEDHEFTKLVVNLKGIDPDDCFSSVPYEKGSAFLYYLEKLFGREHWDVFIKFYFDKFKYKSLVTEEFRECLVEFFGGNKAGGTGEKLKEIDWNKWLYEPGYPPPQKYDDSMVILCEELRQKWKDLAEGKGSGKFKPSKQDLEGWSTNQYMMLLDMINSDWRVYGVEDVKLMDQVYEFSKCRNLEILSRICNLGVKIGVEELIEKTVDLLSRTGRMKYVRPLYRELGGRDIGLARETFVKNREFYHPICRQMVEKDLFEG